MEDTVIGNQILSRRSSDAVKKVKADINKLIEKGVNFRWIPANNDKGQQTHVKYSFNGNTYLEASGITVIICKSCDFGDLVEVLNDVRVELESTDTISLVEVVLYDMSIAEWHEPEWNEPESTD